MSVCLSFTTMSAKNLSKIFLKFSTTSVKYIHKIPNSHCCNSSRLVAEFSCDPETCQCVSILQQCPPKICQHFSQNFLMMNFPLVFQLVGCVSPLYPTSIKYIHKIPSSVFQKLWNFLYGIKISRVCSLSFTLLKTIKNYR